jgi:hypothetical protein
LLLKLTYSLFKAKFFLEPRKEAGRKKKLHLLVATNITLSNVAETK